MRIRWATGLFLSLGAAACGDSNIATQSSPLIAECVQARADVPSRGWVCGEDRTVECSSHAGADPRSIYVVGDDHSGLQCSMYEVSTDSSGPYGVGEHEITVWGTPSTVPTMMSLCTSTLTVRDTRPPSATQNTISLWPPNHKLHHITPADCVEVHDACDANVHVAFTYAASDEPEEVNRGGDGHHWPDIVDFDCDAIDVRAERQGGSNGRVYTLGWYAVDDSGNEAEGTCKVRVQHDQSGRVAVDDGVSYRVSPSSGAATCKHNPGGGTPTGGGTTGGGTTGGGTSGGGTTGGTDTPPADGMDPRGDI